MRTKTSFRAVYDRPMSPGTRCHQLAMYVVLRKSVADALGQPVELFA